MSVSARYFSYITTHQPASQQSPPPPPPPPTCPKVLCLPRALLVSLPVCVPGCRLLFRPPAIRGRRVGGHLLVLPTTHYVPTMHSTRCLLHFTQSATSSCHHPRAAIYTYIYINILYIIYNITGIHHQAMGQSLTSTSSCWRMDLLPALSAHRRTGRLHDDDPERPVFPV